MRAKARFLDVLQWAIVALIFVFLGRTVLQDWTRVKDTSFFLKGGPLFWATLIFASSYIIQVWAWYLITVKLGIAISFGETLKSWFYSQLGKYLPGKVWLLLGRFYLYGSKGKSKKAISVALYFETVIGVVAAGVLFLATLILFEEARPFYSGKEVWWLIFPLALAFLSLYPPILEKILNLILRRFKREPVSVSISYPEILWVLFISLLAWIMGGAAFYLFTNAVFAIPSNYILFLTGSLAFACFLGLVAIFAPSGLGVREGVLVYLLSAIMPGSVAVIVSILTRIWMTLIEIGLIGMIYLICLFRKRERKGNLHG
jgi:hypothetical protein